MGPRSQLLQHMWGSLRARRGLSTPLLWPLLSSRLLELLAGNHCGIGWRLHMPGLQRGLGRVSHAGVDKHAKTRSDHELQHGGPGGPQAGLRNFRDAELWLRLL